MVIVGATQYCGWELAALTKENIGVNLIHTEVRCDHTEYDMNANISSSWKL